MRGYKIIDRVDRADDDDPRGDQQPSDPEQQFLGRKFPEHTGNLEVLIDLLKSVEGSQRVRSHARWWEDGSDIHPTNRTAFGALQVSGGVVPIPVGKIGDVQSAVVMAAESLRS